MSLKNIKNNRIIKIITNIFVLILIFLYLIKLLSPLKNISSEITKFANGDLSRRLDIKSKDVLKEALQTYDGTLILVSHDRDFLQGLSEKVFEFKEKLQPNDSVVYTFAIEKELENIIEICKQEFKIFKPKHIRFWSKNKKQKNVCQNHIVGNIQEICVSKKPINYENVALEKITNLDFYAWYEKMYTQFHKDFPELKAYVSINSLETFTDIMKQKMCYFIYFEGEKVGLIAANKDECLGMPSIYMYEIIIDKKFKGKKIATASQRKLIELHKENYTYINGNIDSRNIPSTKNALSVGRKIISSEILL